ncbi:MAG: PLP-dependent aminotransferase family protein [Eubacteriaceae bacterium]|nr:PLP-dependent aminotransferase family protein [Eubacteriaceae bacterium]
MKAIMPVFDEDSSRATYLQLYDHIKDEIVDRSIVPGEKLPSLRNLSASLGLSLTTVEGAYNQLAVEGYISSRPQSGFYVSDMFYPGKESDSENEELTNNDAEFSMNVPCMKYDLSCFDFTKWKKCISCVLNDHPQTLLFESDPNGEEALRMEISKYVYAARGVRCSPDQIVVGAGTQQITSLLASLLDKIGFSNVATEDPGYLPVTGMFRDCGFSITPVPVEKDGIDIDKLPSNIRCAAYVNPSNQFPTGAVMAAGKRYRLLDWASKNNSYIIEDDYDSELRYFGKPIPSLHSLDTDGRVIYLGSFSSTLFEAVKISYMVLPDALSSVFDKISDGHSQTCSKTEQLALAIFMEKGHYRTGIKKLRRLYSQKLQKVLKTIPDDDFITVLNANSGINMRISVKSPKPASKLCREAEELGIYAVPLVAFTDEPLSKALIFYYNRIPLDTLGPSLVSLFHKWKS